MAFFVIQFKKNWKQKQKYWSKCVVVKLLDFKKVWYIKCMYIRWNGYSIDWMAVVCVLHLCWWWLHLICINFKINVKWKHFENNKKIVLDPNHLNTIVAPSITNFRQQVPTMYLPIVTIHLMSFQ